MAKANRGRQAASVISRIEKACVEKGMKMTEQRRVIARVLSESTDHPDVEEVYGRASAIDNRISIATVYRTLRLFDIANIINRHDFGDGRSRYEIADEVGHHHHLIDMKTGHVLEFEDAELEEMKKRIARRLGYDLVGDRLELYGVRIGGTNEEEQKDPEK